MPKILDFKDLGCKVENILCTFKIDILSQNEENMCINEMRQYQNQDQDAKAP